MVHVIGPSYDGVFLKASTPDFSLQDYAGVESGERVKVIVTHRAGVITNLRQPQPRWDIHNAEFTARVHDFPRDDPRNAVWPGEPQSEQDLYRARWAERAYMLYDGVIEECLFRWLHKEHGPYLTLVGNFLVRRNVFDHCAGQGLQIVQRPNEIDTALWPLDPDAVIDIRGNAFNYCGLWHGRGRAAFACTAFGGAEVVVVRRNRFIHDHDRPGWLQWIDKATPGAINIDRRRIAKVLNNRIAYKGMRSRPVIRLNGATEHSYAILRGNDFIHGGKIDVTSFDAVVIARNTYSPADPNEPEPIVRVWDRGGVNIHTGPISQDWTT